jgi:hypothetical protein
MILIVWWRGRGGIDLSNVGGSGGPYGFGSGLGQEGGAQNPYESMKSTGSTAKSFGTAVMGAGAGAFASALAGTGLARVGVGAVAMGAGFIIFRAGGDIERMGAEGRCARAPCHASRESARRIAPAQLETTRRSGTSLICATTTPRKAVHQLLITHKVSLPSGTRVRCR